MTARFRLPWTPLDAALKESPGLLALAMLDCLGIGWLMGLRPQFFAMGAVAGLLVGTLYPAARWAARHATPHLGSLPHE